MKLCRYCNKEYPDEYFGVSLTTANRVYRRHKCKFCYHKNKINLRNKYGQIINDYKRNKGCEMCGITDYRVLEFHHRNPKHKEFTVAEAYFNKVGIAKIMEEIKKCAILCANCHRIQHWR